MSPPRPNLPSKDDVLAAFTRARGNASEAARALGITQAELEARVHRLSLVRRVRAIRAATRLAPTPPRVRKPGEREPARRIPLKGPAPLPKRGADRPPRGRLAQGAPVLRDGEELWERAGQDELRRLIASFKGNRRAMLERLNALYRLPSGPLDEADLETLMARQGLNGELAREERENLKILFTMHKGKLEPVAQALRMEPAELQADLERRGLWEHVARLREHFRQRRHGP